MVSLGALPKRKISRARRGERRSHLHLAPLNLATCPQCRAPRLPHTVCRACGYYQGREVIEVKSKQKK
ncbi:MAG: 50S ribosomal protein L32 [Chloroflexota bacterium]